MIKRLRRYCYFWFWSTYYELFQDEFDTERDVQFRIKHHFINTDLSPKTCMRCYNTSFQEEITNQLESTVCEKVISCMDCKKTAGYWAYGHYEP